MSDFMIYVEETLSHDSIEDGPFCPFPCGGYCDCEHSIKNCSECEFAQESYMKVSSNERKNSTQDTKEKITDT